MKQFTNRTPEDFTRVGHVNLSEAEEQLLNIYWCKKELEGYLPNIAKYATPKEVAAITISQLAIMEKHLLALLQQISNDQNRNFS